MRKSISEKSLCRQVSRILLLESRLLLTGSVSGTVFADYDQNGVRGGSEPGIGTIPVYADLNDNSLHDAGEPQAITGDNGAYQLSNLTPGNHKIRVILADDWERTRPVVATGKKAAKSALPSYVPGQLMLSVRSRHAVKALHAYLSNHLFDFTSCIDFARSRELWRATDTAVLQLQLDSAADAMSVASELASIGMVEWASPNFIYPKPAVEFAPNDPGAGSQYQHALMNNAAAWDITTGNHSVVIAVIDDGVDWSHPDLQANIWHNSGEIEGNHLDDDGNGYIDDTRGWDVVDHDNDPAPDTISQSHGTHVAGIAAASIDNGIGIAGVAGNATILPIRVIDPARSFSSAVLAEAYVYAANNGARIAVSSYNTDDFVNDPIYKAGLQYLYDHGVLHFNSAGNSNWHDPTRQVFDQSILVASMDANDVRASGSNYGWGIDLSAPGASILSTIPGNQYAYMGATRMAAPAPAWVAALVWSAHPEYTRDQVAARIIGLTDSIDAANVGYEGKLGSGRVNSYRSLTEPLPPPKFRTDSIIGLPDRNGAAYSSPASFSIDVANVFDANSVSTASNWQLRGAGPDQAFGTGDDTAASISLETAYAVGSNRLRFAVNSALSEGKYQFIAHSGASGLRDPFGTPLDGNGDGTAGDDFVYSFSVLPQAPAQLVTIADNQNLANVNFALFDHSPVRVTAVDFGYQVDQSLVLSFSKMVDGPLDVSQILLKNLSSGAIIDNSNWRIQIDSTGRYATVTLATRSPLLNDGRYLLTLKPQSVHDAFGNTQIVDQNFGFFILAADANRDCTVDSLDFNTLVGSYGDRDRSFSSGDFDYNHRVDTRDFNILVGHYGQSLPVVLA